MRKSLVMLVAMSFGGFLPATDPASARAADDDVVVSDVEVDPSVRQPHLVNLGTNFDANLFEQHGNGWVLRGDATQRIVAESPALARSRALGDHQLERIEAACGLTPSQRERLLLAMESDIRRFVTEVEAVRSRYLGREVNMNDPAGQKQWLAFQQDVRRCRERMQALFKKGSLFATVLAATLDDGQRDCLAAETAARRTDHWRAMVFETLVKLDDALGLDQEQHEAIRTALLAREPALRTDGDTLARDDPNLRRNLVLMVLAGVDRAPLRATLSPRQWQALSGLMNQGRAMRSWIGQQGVLEDMP
jgi:hypothetical protein